MYKGEFILLESSWGNASFERRHLNKNLKGEKYVTIRRMSVLRRENNLGPGKEDHYGQIRGTQRYDQSYAGDGIHDFWSLWRILSVT